MFGQELGKLKKKKPFALRKQSICIETIFNVHKRHINTVGIQ